MARPRGKKRTAAQAAATESVEPEAATGAPNKPAAAATEPAGRGRGKRVNAPPKPKPETDYFPDNRNLDLWLSAFSVGTEWENIDKTKEFNWSFEHLEKALEEGGELHGKTVCMFGNTEPQLLDVNGESKIVLIPIVVVVDCRFPPSDKIGINSVQRENEEIVPMKAMNMAWVPYVPPEDRLSRIDSLKTKNIHSRMHTAKFCAEASLSKC